jgi:hypothetical protein
MYEGISSNQKTETKDEKKKKKTNVDAGRHVLSFLPSFPSQANPNPNSIPIPIPSSKCKINFRRSIYTYLSFIPPP